MSRTSLRVWRGTLLALGGIFLATGAGVLLIEVRPDNYPGIALWLVAALVVNDTIGAAAVFAVSVLLRRIARSKAGTRIPLAVFAIVQGALVVGVIVTVVVVPEVFHRAAGTANPTVLPLDYGSNLLLVHAILVGVMALMIATAVMWRRIAVRRTPQQLAPESE